MQALGYRYYSIGTKLAFDAAEAFPKLLLEPVRPLTDAEADAVIEMRSSPAVKAILSEGSELAHEAPAEAPMQLPAAFTQAPKPVAAPPAPASYPASAQQAAPAPVTPQVTAPAPTVQAAPAAAPSDFEASLDAQLNALLPDVLTLSRGERSLPLPPRSLQHSRTHARTRALTIQGSSERSRTTQIHPVA
jgi:hypothetical protein